MHFPKFSFSAAFLIWFVFLAALWLTVFQNSEIPKVSLEVDAELIGNIEQHQKSSFKTEKEKSFLEKNSKEKNSEEKIESPLSKSKEETKTADENKISQKIIPLYQPLPQIPEDLRNEAFNSFAVARFHVAPNGSVIKVEMITPCQNSRLNQLLLKSLQNWKFSATLKSWTQDIRVTFKVE